MPTPHPITTIVCCCLISALSARAHAAILELRNQVTTDKAVLRLGDVADVSDVSPEVAESLRRITLQPAPLPGEKMQLKLETIENRLRAHGVDLSDIELRGNTNIVVLRKGESSHGTPVGTVVTMPAKVVLPAEKLATKKPSEPAKLVQLETAKRNRARDLVTDAIRERLATTAQDWGRPHVFVPLRDEEAQLVLNAVIDGVRVVEGHELRENRFQLTIETEAQNGAVDHFTVLAEIRRRPQIVTAKWELPEGRVVQAQDLEWKEVDDLRNGVGSVDLVVGKELRRRVRAGEAIKLDTLQEPLLVRKGDLCLVVSDVAGVRTSLRAEAQKDGRLGDIVTFNSGDRTNPKSPKIPLRARVIGAREAEISDLGNSKPSVTLQVLNASEPSRVADIGASAPQSIGFQKPSLPVDPSSLSIFTQTSRLESPFPSTTTGGRKPRP